MFKHAYVSDRADEMIYLFCRLGAGLLFTTLLISIPQIVCGSAFFNQADIWLPFTIALCITNMAFAFFIHILRKMPLPYLISLFGSCKIPLICFT
jgi:hypothetical protein